MGKPRLKKYKQLSLDEEDFLRKVSGWTKEQCSGNIETLKPFIIECIQNAAFIDDLLKPYKILSKNLIPFLDNLEGEVFAKIGKHVIRNIDQAFGELEWNVDQDECMEPICNEVLVWIKELGDYLEATIISTSERLKSSPNTIDLNLIKSLLKYVLHYLHEVYRHCNESSGVYGDYLQDMSSLLTYLFQRAYSLQMALLDLLNKVSVKRLKKDVLILSPICTQLFDVCKRVTTLDVKLSVSLWKCITRLCNQHLSYLKDQSVVCPFVIFLCDEIKKGYDNLFQLSPNGETLPAGDSNAFSKSVKIVGFQIKVVVAFLRDFADNLGDSETNVLELLLYLQRYLPPCLSSRPLSESQEAEVRAHIVNATLPCLTHLLGNRAFTTLLIYKYSDDNVDNRLPRLFLQIMVLDLLMKSDDDVRDSWFKPMSLEINQNTNNILMAIFSSVQKCDVEMKLPVMLAAVVPAGQPPRKVNLYEYTATHICALIGTCPARHFKTLESILLTQVCGHCDLVSMLAVDCFCFLARYGTATLSNSLVLGLIDLYKKLVGCKGPAVTVTLSSERQRLGQRVGYLLSRLIKFLLLDHQTLLVKQYPPEQHPDLWFVLEPSGLSPDLASIVTKRLAEWTLSELCRPETVKVKLSKLMISLQLVASTMASFSNSPQLSFQQSSVLQQIMTKIWKEVRNIFNLGDPPLDPAIPQPVLTDIVLVLLRVSMHMTNSMCADDVAAVLSTLRVLLNGQSCSLDIAMAAAHFASGLANIKLENCHSVDEEALVSVRRVFHTLLKHQHPIVHQRALSAFSTFVSRTQHKEIIPECLMGDESLTQVVKDFINQKPHQTSEESFNLVKYLRDTSGRTQAVQVDACRDDNKNVSQEIFMEWSDDEQPEIKFNGVINDDEVDNEAVPRPLPPLADTTSSRKEYDSLTVSRPLPPLANTTSSRKEYDSLTVSCPLPPLADTTSSRKEYDSPTVSRPLPPLADTTSSRKEYDLPTDKQGNEEKSPTTATTHHIPGSEEHLKWLLNRLDIASEITKARKAWPNDTLPQYFVEDALLKLRRNTDMLMNMDWI